MPKLKCDACSCAYNNDYYCCVNGIEVGGHKASDKGETCCKSFSDNEGNMTNSCQSPNPQMEIGCKATNCVHNDQCKCSADEVCICGDHACNCDETKCDTFSCK